MAIHPSAIIDPKSEIASDVEIGPYCVVGAGVKIGSRTRLIAHVYLEGEAEIGEANVFYPFCVCGTVPQDLKYRGEASRLKIGNRNTIREYVSINRGTEGGGMLTSIGDDNLLMAYVHVAHDVLIGNHTILANNVTFAGHVIVEDYANVGGFCGIHQFCRIGRNAMIGSYSVINQSVLPYSIVSPPREVSIHGANRVGMDRRGIPAESIDHMQKLFRLLSKSGLNTSQALERIKEEIEPTKEIEEVLSFIQAADRGFVK